ncbi:MAG: dienelactone hydrolase family protein [Myxococcales bacterium]
MQPLADFEKTEFTSESKTKTVYRKGTGPAVLVLHEIPGIHPGVAAFARRLVDSGFTAVMPQLFGEPDRPMSAGYIAKSFVDACVSREFELFAARKTSPVTSWLRALGRQEHQRAGGPGIGVVGMCITGGFALAMMVDETVLVPVLSQPSLPLGITADARQDLGISDTDLCAVRARAAQGVDVLGLRFTGDPLVPTARFERLRKELGDHFIAVEIDSSFGNPHGNSIAAHSVLTEHLIDRPGHPTRQALDQVLTLLRTRLLG